MRIPGLAIFSFLSILALSVSRQPGSSDELAYGTFTECLLRRSNPSYPISSAIYFPSNSSYSSVLQSYIRNLRFNESDTPKPQLILTALHESHIQTAIICAKYHGLQMRIRSGGHDFEGSSYVSNAPFFILDMFNLRSFNVSIEDETAWVEAGASVGEVYYKIGEKSNIHGFPTGTCPTVGVGGLFSGGGYGFRSRKYGLSVDNIIDARLVDVNGRILDRASMGEDLFWAITGGGGSSFGVVLAYKIKLVRLPPKVAIFTVQRTYEQNLTDIAYSLLQIVDKLDKEIFLKMVIDVVNDNRRVGKKTIRGTFLCYFIGDSTRLFSLVNKKFPELGLRKTDCTEHSWAESLVRWNNFPSGTPVEVLLSRVHPRLEYLKRKSDYLKKPIPKQGLESIFKKMIELETPLLKFFPYGGFLSEISPSEKPFPHRAGNIVKIEYATNWDESGILAANHYINLTRNLYNYMTPFVSKSRGAFFNYRDFDLGINHHAQNSYIEGAAYGNKYFKDNFHRLVQIKTSVDPENFFRNDQSIPIFQSIGSQ
ncbi:FAD-binding Berberine family protein [Abeliophyllum distichum]|uniref:FAD-binding Berberine family protein n=1 Tax=Abeliophyllum distichum TaxID=126358 RepID=A0ABD1UI09_9LAMI